MTPLSPKEQKVLSFIKTYAEKKGRMPTYMEIQERLGYRSISSIQQFVQQLVHKGYLKAPLGESKKRALELINQEQSELVQLPLEGSVAAGRLTEAVQNRDYVEIPRSLLKNGSEYFALKVKGDSMIEDCIMDGDTVIIRRQETAQNGQTVVALAGDEATIKRYYKRKTHIELHPANPNYDVIKIINHHDFKILGVLSSVIRRLE